MLEYDDSAFYYFTMTLLSFYMLPGTYYLLFKQILPAIIHDCPMVAERYSQPGKYGRGLECSSRNFDDHVWICDEKNRDPYKTLLPLTDFEGVTDEDLFDDLEGVSDGTAAMTAYNKLQWSFIGDSERLALRNALLQYCELDTLAMVMLWEHFGEVV